MVCTFTQYWCLVWGKTWKYKDFVKLTENEMNGWSCKSFKNILLPNLHSYRLRNIVYWSWIFMPCFTDFQCWQQVILNVNLCYTISRNMDCILHFHMYSKATKISFTSVGRFHNLCFSSVVTFWSWCESLLAGLLIGSHLLKFLRLPSYSLIMNVFCVNSSSHTKCLPR